MIDYRVEIGWHWIWFVVGPLLLTAPVVFWKNHRLDYVTGLCGLLIAITVIFWLADWNTADYVSLRLISHGDLIICLNHGLWPCDPKSFERSVVYCGEVGE